MWVRQNPCSCIFHAVNRAIRRAGDFTFANTTDLYTRNYVENQHGFQCSSIAPFIFQKPEASLLINEILNCPSTQLLPQDSFYYLRKSPKKLVFQFRVACKGVAKACTKLDQIRH